jgi:hypothetical protein
VWSPSSAAPGHPLLTDPVAREMAGQDGVVSRDAFNWLIGHLTDAQTGALAHDRLEEIITEQGRELQRLLLQAHLDLRALRELEQVRHARHQEGGAAGVIGADGVPRRRVQLGHHRLLATVTGTVTVTVRVAGPGRRQCLSGGRGVIAAGGAAFGWAGQTRGHRDGARLVRRRPGGDHHTVRSVPDQ